MTNQTITAVILTKNEEHNIAACIESVRWADDIVVFDSFSEDRTTEIAAQQGAQVLQRVFDHYAGQRNAALEAVEADWILFVDADERITEPLAVEIRQVIQRNDIDGWWVPRKNYIWGRWIQHAGWSPDYQLRLLRRGKARYDPTREVHEVVILDGQDAHLHSPLVHHNYATIRQFLDKQARYTRYEAEIQFKAGLRPKPRKFVTQPLREFWRRYVTLKGYKDGWHGLLLSLLMGYYTLRLYAHLGRMRRAQ